MLMIRSLLAALALLSGHPAYAQTFTLKNLNPVLARKCLATPAKTIAEWWRKEAACPNAAPTPAPTASAPVQLDAIPSNFDRALELMPMDMPPSMVPDDVGAFRMTCSPSHNAYNDPVVYPGRPGASHLHTFFGNTKTDAFSTYASLRMTGESTCHSKLNRSAYWIPAMMNGRGQVVMPDYLTVYYKRWPKDSAMCRQAGICIGIPRGLRMVFGRKMTGEAPSNPIERNATYFNCEGPGGVGGIYPTMAEAAKNCPTGARLGAITLAPACWKGTQLDSPDHRSHLSYLVYDEQNLLRCPATHPYVIPFFQQGAWYATDDTLDRSGSEDPAVQTWHFSSDRMPGMVALPAGNTFHGDWFGAWDDAALNLWQTNCIDKLLSCSIANLGDGTALKWSLKSFTADPRLVPVP